MHWAIGILIGGVFVYAAIDKIAHPADFARIVYHYQLAGPNAFVGPMPANVLSVVLPWIEALAGLLLICGIWRRPAAAVTAAMLVMFLVAVSWALSQNIDIENCGCFSVSGEGRAAGLRLVLSDAAMLLGTAVLLYLAPRKKADSATQPSR